MPKFVRGWIPSVKTRRNIEYKGTFERDLIFWLDYQPDIESFERKEFSYHFNNNNQSSNSSEKKQGRGITCFLIHYKSRKYGLAVLDKYLSDSHLHFREDLLHLIQKYCLEKDYEFRIVSREMIDYGYNIQNLGFLRRYAYVEVSQAYVREIKENMNGSRVRISDLAERISTGTRQENISAIYSMIMHGYLTVDTANSPVDLFSWVTWIGEE
jgi:hypothetical protein